MKVTSALKWTGETGPVGRVAAVRTLVQVRPRRLRRAAAERRVRHTTAADRSMKPIQKIRNATKNMNAMQIIGFKPSPVHQLVLPPFPTTYLNIFMLWK